MRAIIAAIRTRTSHGASTTLSHVYSHTGERDIPYIGNAAADRCAKIVAGADVPDYGNSQADELERHELAYITNTIETRLTEQGNVDVAVPINGHVRKAVKCAMEAERIAELSTRSHRGAIVRGDPKGVLRLIRQIWKKNLHDQNKVYALCAQPNNWPRIPEQETIP